MDGDVACLIVSVKFSFTYIRDVGNLTLTINSADVKLIRKKGFVISCKIFNLKNKKKYFKIPSAELFPSINIVL